jgi:GNAT superfamily N-acetyltransferase
MDAAIRNAAPAEHAALSDLHRRSSYVWEEDRVHLDAHPDAVGVEIDAIEAGRVRVAERRRGELLGFSVVADGGTGVCVLDDLFVEPGAMRQGIGRALVGDVVERAVRDGCRQLTVVAHPRTFGFYERVGFVVGETVSTRFGPAAQLRRDLQ